MIIYMYPDTTIYYYNIQDITRYVSLQDITMSVR